MEIPLFPLRTVLFPGMTLPLRVFEERYRVMVRELLDSGGEFGVLLIRSGDEVGGGAVPFDHGTTARIEACQEAANGQYRLSVRGLRRFRLVRMLPARPYPYGEVAFIDDRVTPVSEPARRAMETVRSMFPVYFRLALSLSDQWARGIRLPLSPHALVDAVAPWLQVDEETKQRLVETEDAGERVALLAEVMDDLLSRTRETVGDYRRRKFAGPGALN